MPMANGVAVFACAPVVACALSETKNCKVASACTADADYLKAWHAGK
jgi:hypothetical protein